MDRERPKGKTVTIVAVAARLVLTKRGDDVAGAGKALKPAGDGGALG
jgi:hypothetical protein